MLVENHTGGRRRQRELMPEQRKGWCLHRILLGDPDACDAAVIAAAFADRSEFAAGSYTGGQRPYTIAVPTDGRVQQMLELCEFGPHALNRWSKKYVGVAAVGDFREHPPTPAQWESLARVCALLAMWTGDSEGRGHTDIPHDWGDKECPGRLLSMTTLRAAVAEHLPTGWRKMSALEREQRVIGAGLVI